MNPEKVRNNIKKRKINGKPIKISLENTKAIIDYVKEEKYLDSNKEAVDFIIKHSLKPRKGNLITKKDIRYLKDEMAILHLGE